MGDLLSDGTWHLSDRVSTRSFQGSTVQRTDGRLLEVSLVRETANGPTSPVVWSTGSSEPRTSPYFAEGSWQRTVEAISDRRYRCRRAEALTILDLDELDLVEEYGTGPDAAKARMRSWITATPASPVSPTRQGSYDTWEPPRRRTFGCTATWA